ncbi:PDR/VanB family oxidoreductase [Hoyosella subflava]|uniref:Iron-sulfur oxidoreductase subunit beta n=1 Tax=Hoyosella subflava (strain DSM 45089 / JCM 17490 / NBRC 109087 / DQS3-9A1) TaxID=443218 RepID=F6EEN9_HOYSD|nr:PDR/VanB family oxidoreductase [Hoyosella subflava]AEF40839.1 Iron-sulfur oxidoreductase subunit beta [Hoyosella subflava DQS3-9A1]
MTAPELLVESPQRNRGTYREVELDLQVRKRERVAEGVVVLTLADPAGADLPEWTPGAHIDLMMTPTLIRQYSLCGDTSNSAEWKVGVLLDPASRGGSQFVHDKLHEGATVRVRGPRNHFPMVQAARYKFIAGGIGITPIYTMIAAAAATNADWQLLYGGRTRSSMAFLDVLEDHGDRVSVCPQDETGMLDLAAELSAPDEDTVVYCCGPEGLLSAVEQACTSWPTGSLHIERFAAKAFEPSVGGDSAFEVECQRSGVSVTVPPDKTIYEAVEEAGVDVLGSCMEGVCGTCECDVIEGEPDPRDSVLSEAERESGATIMICVSRSRSERLVLDL